MSSLPILNCDNCGACCLEQESPPGYLIILSMGRDYATSQEDLERFDRIPPLVMEELEHYLSYMRDGGGHPNNSVCLWFDEETRKCMHYDLRPDICRQAVIVGDDNCQFWRTRHGVSA